MKPYELVVVLHPDLEIDLDTPISKVEGLVASAGGRVAKRDNWGKRRLAYPIKKQQFGLYVFFELELEPAKVRQLEAQLLITEEVIRFLLVNKLVLQRPSTKAKVAASRKTEVAATATKEGE